MSVSFFRKIVAEHESDTNPTRYIRILRQTHRKIQEFPFHGMICSIWVARDHATENPFKIVFGSPGVGDKVPFGDFASKIQVQQTMMRIARVLGEQISFAADE